MRQAALGASAPPTNEREKVEDFFDNANEFAIGSGEVIAFATSKCPEHKREIKKWRLLRDSNPLPFV